MPDLDEQQLLNSVRWRLPIFGCSSVVNGGNGDSGLGYGRESSDEMLNHDDVLFYFNASQRRRCDREVPQVVFPLKAPDSNYAAVVVTF